MCYSNCFCFCCLLFLYLFFFFFLCSQLRIPIGIYLLQFAQMLFVIVVVCVCCCCFCCCVYLIFVCRKRQFHFVTLFQRFLLGCVALRRFTVNRCCYCCCCCIGAAVAATKVVVVAAALPSKFLGYFCANGTTAIVIVVAVLMLGCCFCIAFDLTLDAVALSKKKSTIFLGSANAIVTLFTKLNKIQRSHTKLRAFTYIFWCYTALKTNKITKHGDRLAWTRRLVWSSKANAEIQLTYVTDEKFRYLVNSIGIKIPKRCCCSAHTN